MHFYGSLAEPMSCIIGAFMPAIIQTRSYQHQMGIVDGGIMAILAGALLGMELLIGNTCGQKPSLLVVTDIDREVTAGQRNNHRRRSPTQRVTLVYKYSRND